MATAYGLDDCTPVTAGPPGFVSKVELGAGDAVGDTVLGTVGFTGALTGGFTGRLIGLWTGAPTGFCVGLAAEKNSAIFQAKRLTIYTV